MKTGTTNRKVLELTKINDTNKETNYENVEKMNPMERKLIHKKIFQ